MRIGVDFGTSYTAAAGFADGKVIPIQFGTGHQFRTSVYFPEKIPDPADFVLSAAHEADVDALVRTAKADHRRQLVSAEKRRSLAEKIPDAERRQAALDLIPTPVSRSDGELRRSAILAVRRQWLEGEVRKAKGSVVSVEDAQFGEDAINAYLAEETGNLIESPKSMLGYHLSPAVRHTFVTIISHVLQHVRLTAMRQLDTPIRSVVLGRPVQFRSSMGDQGNHQAIAILQQAAELAGFDEVEFLEEPAAAAMYYHSSQRAALRSLIVDVGGGTTDLALADIGGDGATPIIHKSWGLANGGTDLDVALNLQQFMPFFGRHEELVYARHFVEAASIQDIPRQRLFREHDYREVPLPFGRRLTALQQPGMTTRLNRAVEQMKIQLSEHADSRVQLADIDPELIVTATQPQLAQASESYLRKLTQLLSQVAAEIDQPLDTIFLAGGMSRAPLIQACVRACFPAIPLVKGDPSFGVVSGLGVAAGLA